MCGIIGIQGNKYRNISKSVDLLKHRGPDDDGIYLNEKNSLSLGQTRLSILDVSNAGHQPMTHNETGVKIIFNGEIYNYLELKKDLIQDGFKFFSNTDTEVLISIYLKYGLDMFKKINGIFSFAIWDPRNENLLITRDRSGVKPLYYSNSDDNFIFSSEIKSMLPLIERKELNRNSLNKYLTYLYCPGNETPIKSIFKMNPADVFIVRGGKIVKKWNFNDEACKAIKKSNLDFKELVDQTQNNLRFAVHRQMISDVPLGAFLSGGLDSTAVVALAKEKNPGIQCFTIDASLDNKNSKENNDDLNYAKIASEKLDVSLNIVKVSPRQMADDFEKMIWHLDEPIADFSALNVLYISELAKKNGMKVLLSGVGGDDIFTGYRRHQALNLEHLWSWLPYNTRKLISGLSLNLNNRSTLQRRIGKVFANAHLSKNERLVNYFSWINHGMIDSLYSNDFKNNFEFSNANVPMIDFLEKLDSNLSQIEKMLQLEQRFFLADHNLIYTDKMSMANGVEVRVPFLDNEFLDFVEKIPIKFKIRRNKTKWIFKKSMEGIVPNEIIHRKKAGFGVPLRHWMEKDFSELMHSILSENNLNKSGIFEPKKVNQLLIDNKSGKIDASYTILSIMAIETWCQNFL